MKPANAIFVCYRRADAPHATGRLFDRLEAAFPGKVFRDIDSIPIGVDWRNHVDRTLGGCRVTLIIIGKEWEHIAAADGSRRLDDPADHVRMEIERALVRPDMLVVPVLVDGARVPKTASLPDSLQDINARNAIQIRHDPDFHKDMDRLIRGLLEVMSRRDEQDVGFPAAAAGEVHSHDTANLDAHKDSALVGVTNSAPEATAGAVVFEHGAPFVIRRTGGWRVLCALVLLYGIIPTIGWATNGHLGWAGHLITTEGFWDSSDKSFTALILASNGVVHGLLSSLAILFISPGPHPRVSWVRRLASLWKSVFTPVVALFGAAVFLMIVRSIWAPAGWMPVGWIAVLYVMRTVICLKFECPVVQRSEGLLFWRKVIGIAGASSLVAIVGIILVVSKGERFGQENITWVVSYAASFTWTTAVIVSCLIFAHCEERLRWSLFK